MSPIIGPAEGGGGGSQPVQAVYAGNAVPTPNNTNGFLTFDTLESGTELLDRTDPANPTLLAAGTYALTAQVNFAGGGPQTPGGFYVLQLLSAALGELAASQVDAGNGNTFTVSAVFIAPQGDTLDVAVGNNDGANSITFQLNQATLVKIA